MFDCGHFFRVRRDAILAQSNRVIAYASKSLTAVRDTLLSNGAQGARNSLGLSPLSLIPPRIPFHSGDRPQAAGANLQ